MLQAVFGAASCDLETFAAPKKKLRDFISEPNPRIEPVSIPGNENQGSYAFSFELRQLKLFAIRPFRHGFHSQNLSAAKLDRDRARTLSGLHEIRKGNEQILGD
jgi:hypothetical protein